MITGTTQLAQDEIGDWLEDLIRDAVSPGHVVDVVEWGYGEPWLPSERDRRPRCNS